MLGLAGCSLFSSKKGGSSGTPPASGPGAPPAKFPTTSDPLLSSTSASTPGKSVIAGRVLDEFGRIAPNSHVRLVAVSEKDIAPVDCAAPEGYFTIPDLKPGVDYKLIARNKTGDRLIAGQTQTAAPNPVVVIKMRSDLAGATVPEVPPHVGDTLPGKKTTRLGKPVAEPTWNPGSGETAKVRPDSPGAAQSGEPELPKVKVPSPSDPPRFVTPPGPVADKGLVWPPVMDVPSPSPKPAFTPLPPGPKTIPLGAGPGSGSTLGPARVPSCVLVGKQLINLALNDINGEPWEFRSNRKGKLVLLDFWGTWCMHCRPGLPLLRDLDHKYASQGLEVIGIAFETTGTPQEQAYRINSVAQGQGVTYRQLLSSGNKCPVLTQFGIRNFPTLVLLDENGWVLWRHEGVPNRVELDELERWITRRLPKAR